MKNLKRHLVFGDIHGSLASLEQVLERANYDPSSDALTFLGDYVDGWGQSAELIDFLCDLRDENGVRARFLRGNHDQWFMDWYIKGKMNIAWMENGGRATYHSYVNNNPQWMLGPTRDRHIEFLENTLLFAEIKDGDNLPNVFVHGGYTSAKGVGNEDDPMDYMWDRELWMITLSSHEGWEKGLLNLPRRTRAHHHIYIGHTSTTNWGFDIPMSACNVTNLDTGCGWHGKLTCMDVMTREYWQSDLTKTLHPNEKGRK